MAVDGRHLVLRVSWVFGPDRPSFVDHLLRVACEKENVAAVADKFSTPTYTKDIAELLIHSRIGQSGLAETNGHGHRSDHPGCSGILHFTNEGACSWREYLQWAIDCAQEARRPLKARTVGALSMVDMKGGWRDGLSILFSRRTSMSGSPVKNLDIGERPWLSIFEISIPNHETHSRSPWRSWHDFAGHFRARIAQMGTNRTARAPYAG